MNSTLNSNYEVPSSAVGYICDDITTPKAGEKIKVYVPSIMGSTQQGSSSSSSKSSKGNNIFSNESSCKPKSSTTVKSNNYITATVEKNCTWDGIDTVELDGKGKIKKRTVKAGTVVNVNFTNGTLQDATVNTSGGHSSEAMTGSDCARSLGTTYGGDVEESKLEQSGDAYIFKVATPMAAPPHTNLNMTILTQNYELQKKKILQLEKTVNTLMARLDAMGAINLK